MRSLKALYTIPAHKSTVSDVRFFRFDQASHASLSHSLHDRSNGTLSAPSEAAHNVDDQFSEGMYLVSSGYDGMVKIWSADDWQLAKTLSTDAGKVMSVDLSPGGAYVASGSWNRSIQLYARE